MGTAEICLPNVPGRIGAEFAASTMRLRPWMDRGELPAKPTPWQVHGRQEDYQFGREDIHKDHPRRDRPTLDYVRDIVDAGVTEQVSERFGQRA